MILARMRKTFATVLAVLSLAVRPAPAIAEGVPGPVRLVPQDPTAWTRIEAKFAPKPNVCPARHPKNLHAAYPGMIEIGRRADGRLYLVTELDFPRYLKGIAEVPRNWPAESLKAQVVAARTYAIGHMNPSSDIARELNYNLCATDACQVYRGLAVENGAWGEAWSKAVDETSGEILEYRGKPAGTFYFSTSNGSTYSNAEIFGGTPLPYLQPKSEADDGASPLSSWRVPMPLSDLAETLRRAGSWSTGAIDSVVKREETVEISGSGQSISLSVEKFRNQMNNEAVCLVPKRYPTPSSTGRALPQVVPSKWFDLGREASSIILAGKGWGHGVGMVQWGAKGKADRGVSYADILAFYYGGLRPVKREEPGRIRVGLAVDLEEITLERIGTVKVEGAALPAGPARLRGGQSISVEKGPGIAPNLEMDKAEVSPVAPGTPANFSFELSDPANVRVRYRGPGEGETTPEPRDRGPQTLAWDLTSLLPGSYEAVLVANDGVDEILSAPMQVTVAAASPSPSAVPSSTRTPKATPRTGRGRLGQLAPFAALGLLALIVFFTASVARRRRWQRRI